MTVYTPTGGMPTPPPQEKKDSYKKGLGFVPNSIAKCDDDPITTMLRNAPGVAMGHAAHLLETPTRQTIELPSFDLNQLCELTGRERQAALHAFGGAFIQQGLLAIYAPNLSKTIPSVYAEMNKYFSSPLETKLLDWKKGISHQGYCHRGGETGPHAPRPDFKESFFVSSNFKAWPAHLPGFKKNIPEYHAALSQVHHYIMMFLMEFLNEPYDEPAVAGGNHILRLAYYPPFRPGDDPHGMWSAPNRDKSVLTISAPGTIPGLEFYSAKGHWEPVIVPSDHLIVSTGLLLQHKTAGLIKARWKRVVNPGGRYTRMPRLSTDFYGCWTENYSLKPYPECAKLATVGMNPGRRTEYLKKFGDLCVKERLQQKETPLPR